MKGRFRPKADTALKFGLTEFHAYILSRSAKTSLEDEVNHSIYCDPIDLDVGQLQLSPRRRRRFVNILGEHRC